MWLYVYRILIYVYLYTHVYVYFSYECIHIFLCAYISRALQIFKNKKILDLIKDYGAKKSSINTNKFNRNISNDKNNNLHHNDDENDNNDISNDNNDNDDIGKNNVDSNLNVQEPSSLDSVLTALIPALFRGGRYVYIHVYILYIYVYTYIYIHT
jgi:hypothetical protein